MPAALHRTAFGARGPKRATFLPSLALRLTRVADGRFDGLIASGGSQHWDLAAGDLIVQEAGGTLIGLHGLPPRYDTEDTRHTPVIAGAAPLVGALLGRVRQAQHA